VFKPVLLCHYFEIKKRTAGAGWVFFLIFQNLAESSYGWMESHFGCIKIFLKKLKQGL
jgi:hypothetical protein